MAAIAGLWFMAIVVGGLLHTGVHFYCASCSCSLIIDAHTART